MLTEVPDSLLQLKLSDILQSPKLLYLFTNYLKDTRGPVYKLEFALSALEIHNRLNSPQVTNEDIGISGF